MKRALLLVLGIALGVALVGLTPTTPARAGGKPYKEVWEKYVKEKEGFPFKDLSHWVNITKSGDTRWTAKWDGMQRKSGHQLFAAWSLARSENPWDIRVDVFKALHKEQKGSTVTTFSTNFDHIGKSVKTAQVGDIADAYYEDWIKASDDVIEDACKAPKKKKFGKIKCLYSYATATDKTTKARERREWYIWSTANVTWIAQARYQANLLDKDDLLAKGEEFMKLVAEVKDKIEEDEE